MCFGNNNDFEESKARFCTRSYVTRKYSVHMSHMRILPVLMSFCMLSACAVGPDFKRPEVVPPADLFKATTDKNAQQSQVVAGTVETSWWTLFNDDILSELQVRAQKGNLDLQLAATRVAQSSAQISIANAAGLPHLGVGGMYARAADSANGQMALLGAPDAPYDIMRAGFNASWEIDMWGHARRNNEAAAASMLANAFQREGVRVSIAAEVARTYIQLRHVQTQLDITQQNLAIAEQALKLANSRVKNGVATKFESAASSAQLASIRALVPRLEEQRDALMNALALLLGEPPRALNALLMPTHQIPPVPRQVPIGLSSELARRRPDILQAEARLHAATAAIGAAKADFYPRISLVGNLGLESLDLNTFGNWASRTFSVGPTLYLPIFEGGRLRGSLALTKAREQEAAIAYQQTVLNAWHEVDDALSTYADVQRRDEQLALAFNEYRQAYDVALRRYEQGAAEYLMVLTAQRSLLASQLELADNTSRISIAMVNLYKALGGGWAAQADTTGGKLQ
ncbi:efflux transporter outer membrane subunit [Oryzomonas rubra]|uniref:Efflux transporter outer membrane subunit n=2 Tax=Oryzomonas rubra TaxID=2509454 RepID=A0A5A9X6A7_9BACT|nr:efflux transporter outer membrane subunit [Oryzomonas rubra]